MLEVNALGAINGTVATIGAMRGEAMRGRVGHFVTVLSPAGLTPVPGGEGRGEG